MVLADSGWRDADAWCKLQRVQAAIYWSWLRSGLAGQVRAPRRQPGQDGSNTEYHNSNHELRPDRPAEGARDSAQGCDASGDAHRQSRPRDQDIEGAEAQHEYGEHDLRRDAQAVGGLDERLP